MQSITFHLHITLRLGARLRVQILLLASLSDYAFDWEMCLMLLLHPLCAQKIMAMAQKVHDMHSAMLIAAQVCVSLSCAIVTQRFSRARDCCPIYPGGGQSVH